MAVATPDIKPDGTRAEYGRVWLNGRKVSAKTYAAATGGPPASQAVAKVAVEGDVIPPASETLATFQNFMAALAGSAKTKEQQDKALADLGHLIDKLDFRANPDLLQNADVQKFVEMVNEARSTQPSASQPGSTVGEGWNATKKPWTEQDLARSDVKIFESYRAAVARGARGEDLVEYTPRENVEVTYNGVPYKFFADVTVVTAKCFVDQAEYRHAQMRSAEQNAKRLYKVPYDARFLDPSALGRPVDQQGFRTMAHITSGAFNPNAGGNLIAPDQATLDMAAKLDGEGAGGAEGGEGEGAAE